MQTVNLSPILHPIHPFLPSEVNLVVLHGVRRKPADFLEKWLRFRPADLAHYSTGVDTRG